MSKKKKSNKSIVSLQHKLRGYIAEFKSNKFTKGASGHSTSNFRVKIQNYMLDARVSVDPSQFRKFIAWTQQQINTQIPELEKNPIGYDYLSGIYPKAPKASLIVELSWVTERIKAEKHKINSYLTIASKIESYVFKGEFKLAIAEVEKIEEILGASIWGIQLRISLESLDKGIDHQKKYTAEVNKIFRSGLLTFISFYTSTRNESKTTLEKYINNVNNRINRQKRFQQSVKTYLRYQLTYESPSTISELEDILYIEQNHSLIDLFETLIFSLQKITKEPYFKDHKIKALQCVEMLAEIDDYRLDKIKQVLVKDYWCTSGNHLKERDSELSDLLLSEKIQKAALFNRRNISTQPDAWVLIYSGFIYGHSKSEFLLGTESIHNIPKLIGNILNRSENSHNAFSSLMKLAVNLKALPTSVAILDFLKIVISDYADIEYQPWVIGLNSSFTGVEDIPPEKYANFEREPNIENFQSQTAIVWSLFHRNIELEKAGKANTAIILFSAARLIRERSYAEAIELIDKNANTNKYGPLRSLFISLRLQSMAFTSDRDSLINITAIEGARSNENRLLLPIEKTLGSFHWTDYEHLEPFISSISLHLLWLENEDEETASFLRYSIRRTLKEFDVKLPSNLVLLRDRYENYLLIYFFRYVCSIDFIDQLPAINTTKVLMSERQRICNFLCEIDPENSNLYQEEIRSINYKMLMDDGNLIVDRTRIHVDLAAFKRWANKELSEEFSRYRDLIGVSVNSDTVLEDIIKRMMDDSIDPESNFSPETESDIILIDMVTKLKNEFLHNSTFGLDFYLSKRIRHQSFIGLIRSPVESANLITTRISKTGKYNSNLDWLSKFSALDSHTQEKIDDSFRSFSKKFDRILENTNSENFQLSSKNYPKGLIYLPLTPQVLFVLQSISYGDEEFTDFIDTVIEIFWGALETSLIQVRNHINEVIKLETSEAFYELRAEIKSHVDQTDTVYLELDQEIGNCLSDVQSNLDISVQWFTRLRDIDLQGVQQIFSLAQMVDIAISSALKCHKAFEPEIHKNTIEDDITMAITTLVFLDDVIFIAIGNARKYSNIKKPRIDIFVRANSENRTFEIQVCCETKNQNHEKTNIKLDNIRKLIALKNYGQTRKENLSGFIKLAAVVNQNSFGKIDFGYNNAGDFNLNIIYAPEHN